MPIQSSLALVGMAKQTTKGTAIANPTFKHGVTDGSVLSVEVDQAVADLTSGVRVSGKVDRNAVMSSQTFGTRAFPKSLGLYLYGALGSIATTGAGPTYTHVCTVGDTLPYLTGFGQFNGENWKLRDYRVGELSFSWTGNEPLAVSVNGMGTVLSGGATFSASVDDTRADYFRSSGGTFLVDVASNTPVAGKITAGTVTINNSLNPVMVSGSIEPDDVQPSRAELTVSLTIVPDDLSDWKKVVTGSGSGTSVAEGVTYGSFDLEWTEGTNVLTLEASNVAFTCAFPDASPAGGSAEITLEGIIVLPASGQAFTATLVNGQASY